MRLDDVALKDLLASIAAKSPTPGGGAVASITAALAAALAQMVVNYSIGKKALAGHSQLHQDALGRLQEFATQALALAEADAIAYARMNELWRLDQHDERRRRELPAAVRRAIQPPDEALNGSLDLLRLLRDLSGKTNAFLNSDLAVAAVLAEAATRASAWNVRINLPQLEDERERDAIESTVQSRLAEATSLCDQIERACRP